MKIYECVILILSLVHFCIRMLYFQVTFIVKAVSAFSAAVFLVQVEKCQGRNLSECLRTTNINLQQEILSVLSQLSFTSQHKAPFELQGTSIHVTHDGQLISNKYVIFQIRDTGDVSGVSGNYICGTYFMARRCFEPSLMGLERNNLLVPMNANALLISDWLVLR